MSVSTFLLIQGHCVKMLFVYVCARACVCVLCQSSLSGARSLNSAAHAAFVTRMHALLCICVHVRVRGGLK